MGDSMRLTREMIEQMAVEIREFLLEHELWIDVDIYFNGKKFSTHDPADGKYYYNDREHLVVVEDEDPRNYFEYVAEDHILSMGFDGIVCEMIYYRAMPATKREFDRIFEKYGVYYELGHHWNFTCYYI